jgi:hypothetical protein
MEFSRAELKVPHGADRGFVRGDATAAAALPMLSARPCPSCLCVFIRLPPAFALELAILCALLGCTRRRGGRA